MSESARTAPRLGQRLRRWLAGVLATLLIVLAILVGAFRLLVPQVSEYRELIADWAGEALGTPVEIGEIDVRWRWVVPEVVLEEVVLRPEDPDVAPLQAAEIAIRVSPLDLLRPGPLRPGHVILRGGEFEILRREDGRILIPGVALLDPGEAETADEEWETLMGRVLAHADYRVEDSRLRLRDEVLGLGPWEVRIHETRLHSRGDEHRYRARLGLPEAIGGELALALWVEGPAERPQEWQWRADAELQARDLSALGRHLGEAPLRPVTAAAEADLRFHGEGAALTRLQGDLSLEDLRSLVEGPAMEAVVAGQAGGSLRLRDLDWQRERRGWRLTVDGLDLGQAGQAWPESSLDLRLSDQRLGGQLRYGRIADISRLGRILLAPESEAGRWLDRLQPEGEVRDLLGEVRLGEEAIERYRLRGRLTGLGMRSWDDIPGFSGLSGWLRADEEGGRLEVDAGPLAFDYPALFRETLVASHLQTDVHWHRQDDGWDLQAESIRLHNPDIRVRADFGLRWRPDEPFWLELDAEVPEASSENLSDYLPVARMPETAVDWLDRAIQGGQVRNGRVMLEGPSRPFPYRNDEGRFLVEFDVEDGRLDYEEGWLPVTDVDARLRFEQAGLEVEADSGEISGLAIESASARIEDLQAPALAISGRARGSLAEGLRFLRETPLAEWFADPLAPVQLDGPVGVEVEFLMPLDEVADLRLDGRLAMEDIAGRVDWLPGDIGGLSGQLEFTEDGASAQGLTGHHLGAPFTLDIDPGSRGRDAPEDAPARTTARIAGGAETALLRASLPDMELLDWFEGHLDWWGEVRVPNEAEAGPIEVFLESGLFGLDVLLPAPVGKSAEDARPLAVRFPVGGGRSRVEADYADRLALTLDVAVPADAPAGVEGIRIDFGQPRPPQAVAPGIALAGEIDWLDLGQWLRVDWPAGDGEGEGLQLESADLRVAELLAGPLRLHAQDLAMSRVEDEWRLQLDGLDAEGEVRIPLDVVRHRSRVEADLDRLNLVWRALADDPLTQAVEPFSPARIPELSARVDALSRDGMLIGALDLDLMAVPDGVLAERIELIGPDLSAEFRGEWRQDPVEGQWGRLSGWAESQNVGSTLASFGYVPGVDANFGRFESNLSWRGVPGIEAAGSLTGTAELELRSGHLREVSPGAGRVFGLLSLTALPRRLYGDFRDVFGRGLRFDNIQGDFLLVEGDAFTGNLRLEGPSANVTLTGRTGLATRDYDQHVRIDPKVGAALPVAGALAGGTGVGAAVLVLTEIFSGPLSRVGRLEYRIEGGWESPRLIPLDDEARQVLEEQEEEDE